MPNRPILSFPRFWPTDPTMYGIRKTSFLSYYLKFLLPLLILLTSNVSPTQAQGAFFWSEQEKIPSYFPLAQQPPLLIADQDHTVHAFNSQPLDPEDNNSPKAIYYRQWTLSSGWTFPVDILIDEAGGSVEILDVAHSSSEIVYLIYQKNFGDIYFTYTHLSDAGKSTAWAPSFLIARQTTTVGIGFEGVASIAANSDGIVVIVYSGSESGEGLYSTYSLDDGKNWTSPYPVYLIGDESMVVTDPELFLGESGIIHGVWTTYESDGFAGPGYYVNFDPATSVWSEPTELDSPGIRTPSVIEFKSEVIVSYYHFSSNGNWWRRSFDGGKTWSTPIQLSPRHVGTNGRVSFVVDSTNTLHGFFGERINDLNHGMWHTIWMEGSWTPPEAIVRGRQIRDVDGGIGFDPGAARAIISNGNLVLVTWCTDGFAGVNGAWYSYKRLDAPELPEVALESHLVSPTSTSSPAIVKSATATITVGATPGNDTLLFEERPAIAQNPQYSIFIGIIPVVLLIVGMIVTYYLIQEKNK